MDTVLGPAHHGALPEAPRGLSGLQKLLVEADKGTAAEQGYRRPGWRPGPVFFHTPGKKQQLGGNRGKGAQWSGPSGPASFEKVDYSVPVLLLPEHCCEGEESQVAPGGPEGLGPFCARHQGTGGFLEREHALLVTVISRAWCEAGFAANTHEDLPLSGCRGTGSWVFIGPWNWQRPSTCSLFGGRMGCRMDWGAVEAHFTPAGGSVTPRRDQAVSRHDHSQYTEHGSVLCLQG